MPATHFYGAEFFGGEFFFGSITSTGPKGWIQGKKRSRRHDEEYWAARIAAQQRLRDQIEEAIAGPKAPVAKRVLEAYIAPQYADKPSLWPKNINWEAIYGRMDRVQRELDQAIEDDDDEDWLLLNG